MEQRHKSLAEYAAEHPQQLPDQDREAARVYQDQAQAREEIGRLKASILYQLEQGNAPQYILYPALKAIGMLTNDPDFTASGIQILDSIYADLAQESLLIDELAAASERLERMQAEYNSKLERQLERSLNGYRRIEHGLTEALRAARSLQEGSETTEGEQQK